MAKLSRWDDRSKIGLKNTLLPYLTGLLEHGKIDAKDALALNRLANPVEYYFAGTKEFAEALRSAGGLLTLWAIAELITQFQDDNPDLACWTTPSRRLPPSRMEALGSASESSMHLAAARVRYAEIRDTHNERSNYSDNKDLRIAKKAEERDCTNRKALKCIAAATNPIDEASLIKAIDEFNDLDNMYDLKSHFFADLRNKVPYGDRAKYVRNVTALENLFFYWKFEELKKAKEAWEGVIDCAHRCIYGNRVSAN